MICLVLDFFTLLQFLLVILLFKTTQPRAEVLSSIWTNAKDCWRDFYKENAYIPYMSSVLVTQPCILNKVSSNKTHNYLLIIWPKHGQRLVSIYQGFINWFSVYYNFPELNYLIRRTDGILFVPEINSAFRRVLLLLFFNSVSLCHFRKIKWFGWTGTWLMKRFSEHKLSSLSSAWEEDYI